MLIQPWSPPPPLLLPGTDVGPSADVSTFVPGAPKAAWSPDRVSLDADYQRVHGLPRTPWDEAEDLQQLTAHLTRHLLKPGGERACAGGTLNEAGVCSACRTPTRLRPIQAAALRALYDVGGVFASMAVGSGKTAVTLLAPTLLGAQWPLLVVKASSIEPTLAIVLGFAKHWRVHPAFIRLATAASKAERKRIQDVRPCLLGYEELGRDAGGLKLIKADPDFLALDECQKVKNRSAAVTKKIKRAIGHWRKSGPGASAGSGGSPGRRVAIAALSGSVAGRSFGEYWLPIRWALGPAGPLPLELKSFLSWCYAMDEKVPELSRLDPGPLVDLSPGAVGETPLARARDAYARRFASCPGVISSKDDIPPYGLEITVERFEAPPGVRAAIQDLRENWATPDGNEFEHAIELWIRERWLSKGGWYCWDPMPPSEWRHARREWHRFIRETLKNSRSVDSPDQVRRAVEAGRLKDEGTLSAWREVEPSFSPRSVWRWLEAGSHVLLEDAAKWLLRTDRGIVWVQHEALGNALAAMTGAGFYHQGASDSRGTHITRARGRAICSIKSCGEGHNLQHEFSHNYMLEMPTTGPATEQLFGRTHRPGQVEDEVTVKIPLMTEGDAQGLGQAIKDARYAFESRGEPQKLIYGTWLGDSVDAEGLL